MELSQFTVTFFPQKQLHLANAFFSLLPFILPQYLMIQIQAEKMKVQQSLNLKIKQCTAPPGEGNPWGSLWGSGTDFSTWASKDLWGQWAGGAPCELSGSISSWNLIFTGRWTGKTLSWKFLLLVYSYFHSGCWKALDVLVTPVVSIRTGKGKSSGG